MMKRILIALTGWCACAGTVLADGAFNWTASDEALLRQHVDAGDYGQVTSIVILRDGNPVFEGYFNGADAATLHDTRSVTKTITGMAVGLAIVDGVLALDAPLAPLFAQQQPFDNPDPRKDALTAIDLLTMSGPLECDDWNQFSRGNEERMYLVEDWSAFFWDLPVRGYPSWSLPPQDRPYGRAFSYCTAGIQLLGEVVQRASGQPFTDYVEARLFEPLGIEDFQWARNGLGQAHMGGGLRLTARGLAQFGELQRRGGEIDGQRILPEAWTQASAQPHANIPDRDGWEYGLLWWLLEYQVDGQAFQAPMMAGNGGNRVMILPDFDLTIALTKTDYNTRSMHDEADAFFAIEIVERLSTQ